jgi:hypothetical protein
MASWISRLFAHMRNLQAPACLAVLAGVSSGGQLNIGCTESADLARTPSISERIGLIRLAYQNQTKSETPPASPWLLAQWYNFGNFRPPQYGVPQYGVPQYGVPQYGVPQYGVPQYGVPYYQGGVVPNQQQPPIPYGLWRNY